MPSLGGDAFAIFSLAVEPGPNGPHVRLCRAVRSPLSRLGRLPPGAHRERFVTYVIDRNVPGFI